MAQHSSRAVSASINAFSLELRELFCISLYYLRETAPRGVRTRRATKWVTRCKSAAWFRPVPNWRRLTSMCAIRSQPGFEGYNTAWACQEYDIVLLTFYALDKFSRSPFGRLTQTRERRWRKSPAVQVVREKTEFNYSTSRYFLTQKL